MDAADRPTVLPAHRLNVVLVEPEIPQNAGNIARLCAVTGGRLHLVRPLGFFLTEKHFKRAGMDYIDRAALTVHDSLAALHAVRGDAPLWLTSGKGGRGMWEADFAPGDWIFFGRESAGLPPELLADFSERIVTIPMIAGSRGLNQATAAGIVLYEALRQVTSRADR
jgi:tRNA (cytidine/uridine-2'-O-)-methyltransferase